MKTKSGLQKPISSIFDSIPQTKIIENGENEMPSASSIQPRREPVPASPPEQSETSIQNPQANAAPAAVQYADLVPVEVDRKPKESAWLRNLLIPMVAMVFATAIILLAALTMGVFTKYEQVAIADAPAAPTVPIAQEMPAIEWQIPEPADTGSRNITQGDADQENSAENIIIKGILYGTDRSLVIIGTELHSVGDIVSGAEIIAIDRKSVEFEKDNRRWTQKVQ